MDNLYISGINYESFADGDGIRTVIFFSGCKHNCIGCQSTDTHNFKNGQILSDKMIKNIKEEYEKRPYLSGITLSGGDPMYSAKSVLNFINQINTKKTIWCYSGFLYEDIILDEDMKKLLMKCDVLVDGKFIQEQRDITLKFRGSKNQRIIDVKKSLKEGKVILFE